MALDSSFARTLAQRCTSRQDALFLSTTEWEHVQHIRGFLYGKRDLTVAPSYHTILAVYGRTVADFYLSYMEAHNILPDRPQPSSPGLFSDGFFRRLNGESQPPPVREPAPRLSEIWIPYDTEYSQWCQRIGDNETRRLFDSALALKRHLKSLKQTLATLRRMHISGDCAATYSCNIQNITRFIQ